jgi:hypothetical protein
MHEGVSDISALRYLLDNGARIRGIKNLHSKLYLFGQKQVIVTSANLTEAALGRNHEFGFVATEAEIVKRCRKYFDDLWKAGAVNLLDAQISAWETKLQELAERNGEARPKKRLGDEGREAEFSPFAEVSGAPAPQGVNAFVKFFGTSATRLPLDSDVFAEVERAGCHWACTYPKRPRQVQDGDVLFVARMTRNPSDIIVFGRAIGSRHVPRRDKASRQDIKRRAFKKKWPYYIRVNSADFVAGTLADGVSLNQLMAELGSDSFASTQKNAEKKSGNTNPRKAYRRQPQVELTREAQEWMHAHLEAAFAEHGKLSEARLKKLDWPKVMVAD